MSNKNIRRIEWNSHNDSCYQSYEDILNNLEKQIKESGEKFDYICGITRGGLTPAVELSHCLEIKFLDFSEFINLFISLRKKFIEYPKLKSEQFLKNKILLVDDICHSGNTINSLLYNKHELKEVFDITGSRFITLVRNELYKGTDIWAYGIEATKDDWIKFPWESEIKQSKAEKMIQNHIELVK